jgi:aryl-alcohol dehydrogenase-like predicted oxidoreductase
MQYTSLGPNRISVPRIGQGGGGGEIRDAQELKKRADALRFGLDCGMTLLDTAEAYHQGRSEIAVGQAVQGRRAQAFIATKVSPEHLHRADLLRAAEASLQRLQTDYLDLYQVHWSNSQIPLEETLAALAELVASGKVRQIGLCNFSRKEIRAAQAAFAPREIVALQAEYNLFDRSAETSLFPSWQAPGRIFLAYSPLEQGSLAGSESRRRKLEALAARYAATPAQLALAWIISHPGIVAIPKASRREHILENASAADLPLSEADIQAIDETFASHPLTVPVDRIRVALDGLGNRAVYQTVEEARANRLGLAPSPCELAEDIRTGEFLKPVRVRPARGGSGTFEFDLIEGRLRYWAWVIAFDGQRPIDVLLREN